VLLGNHDKLADTVLKVTHCATAIGVERVEASKQCSRSTVQAIIYLLFKVKFISFLYGIFSVFLTMTFGISIRGLMTVLKADQSTLQL
jgi:hypothetical protein